MSSVQPPRTFATASRSGPPLAVVQRLGLAHRHLSGRVGREPGRDTRTHGPPRAPVSKVEVASTTMSCLSATSPKTRLVNIAMTRKRMAMAWTPSSRAAMIGASSRSSSLQGSRSSRARPCASHHITRVANRPHAGRYDDLALSAGAHRTVEAFIVRPTLCHAGPSGPCPCAAATRPPGSSPSGTSDAHSCHLSVDLH